jgi:anti-sigma factor RsiW
MACDEFEILILEYLENQLSPAERSAVETHLASCANCQAFARQLNQLNAALTRGIKSPKLSPEFNARLQQRIQTEGVLLSEAQHAERKRQLQAEFEADLAQLRRKWLSSTSLIDILCYGALAATMVWLILAFAPTWTTLVAQHGPGNLDQNLWFFLLISAVFLSFGLSVAFPRQLKKIWMAI